jgi:LuxR family transcriptional regulator, maltose regulon positive regulatory protein
MAGDQDMGEMLKTRDKPRLGSVSLNGAADDEGSQRIVPRTRFDSPPQLTVVNGEDATVVPRFSQQRGALVGLPSTLGDSHSGMAVRGWFVQSLLVEAVVRYEAGQGAAAEHVLERALELAEHDRVLLPFLVDPVPELLERHASRDTAHADLISEIFELRTGLVGAGADQASGSLPEPLTESEIRILRLLGTDLSKREIGNELYVSVNTVKTHVKHLYAKLDVRTRRQAVERARALGLLTYSSR